MRMRNMRKLALRKFPAIRYYILCHQIVDRLASTCTLVSLLLVGTKFCDFHDTLIDLILMNAQSQVLTPRFYCNFL